MWVFLYFVSTYKPFQVTHRQNFFESALFVMQHKFGSLSTCGAFIYVFFFLIVVILSGAFCHAWIWGWEFCFLNFLQNPHVLYMRGNIQWSDVLCFSFSSSYLSEYRALLWRTLKQLWKLPPPHSLEDIKSIVFGIMQGYCFHDFSNYFKHMREVDLQKKLWTESHFFLRGRETYLFYI